MSDFFKFLLSPLGLVVLLAGVIFFVLASTRPVLRWIGLGMTLYAASLQKFFNKFTEEEGFRHLGPIETLVQNGRPITALLMVALLLLSLSRGGGKVNLTPPRLMWPIHAIQLLLLLKMLTGNVSGTFVIQAGVIYCLVGLLAIFVVSEWLSWERTLAGPAVALTIVLALFCGITEMQLRFNPQAVVLYNGRLIGTCGNPQHAATLLAVCLPGPLYLLLMARNGQIYLRLFSALVLISTFHLLLLTGSRTGAMMAVIVVGLFFRKRVILVLAVGLFCYVFYTALLDDETKKIASRLVSMEDTRTNVWKAQWQGFLRHPFIGEPISGNRIGFGENSWLGLLQKAGLAGGACLVWLLFEIAHSMKRLRGRIRLAGHSLISAEFCLAGLLALFVGSFLEAYLLGIITLPILALLTYAVSIEHILKGAGSKKLKRSR